MLAIDDIHPAAAAAAASSASAGGGADPAANAQALIHQATDSHGHVDTRQLAHWVTDAAGHDFDAASQAHAHIEQQLSPADASRFNHDIVAAAAASPLPGGLWAAGQQMLHDGTRLLVENPILVKRWEPTRSAWTNRGGFTDGLRNMLVSHGIEVPRTVRGIPAGSVGPASGIKREVASNINGAVARDAIANELRQQPAFRVQTEVPTQGGARVVDVRVHEPAADPRMNKVVDIESKVGRYSRGKDLVATQIKNDGKALQANRLLRGSGQVLERVGKVARPVGLAIDAIQVGTAFHADGNRVGMQTGRAVSNVAGGALGGWGGAAAGAAIGTMIFPGVGTAVGGIVGGIGGAIAGSEVAKAAFDKVASWF